MSIEQDVAAAYQAAELSLIERIAALVAASLDVPNADRVALGQLQALREQAVADLTELSVDAGLAIMQSISEAYDGAGVGELRALATELPVEVVTPRVADQSKLRTILREVGEGIVGAQNSVLRQVDDSFRTIVADVLTDSIASGQPRKQAAKVALQRMFEQGLTFKDRGGRNWSLSNYAAMAVRTGNAQAAVAGHEAALDAAGLDLVVVHPGPRACKVCDRWARALLSRSGVTGDIVTESAMTGAPLSLHVDDTLAGARAGGFQHPNCRCSIRGFIPGVTKRASIERPKWDAEGYEAQQEQRGIEVDIRKAKLERATALDDLDKGRAQAAVLREQARMREHLKQNDELKRQSSREQLPNVARTPKLEAVTSTASAPKSDTPAKQAAPFGLDAETLIRNAATMFGEGSPQHRAAIKKLRK